MAPYILAPCTLADAPAISRNNMSAFWPNPSWVIIWRHTTLAAHIPEVAKRYPRNLISDRATVRHQKAVDPATAQLLGYARWILPSARATTAAAGTPVWPEALGPAVTAAEEAEIRRVAATAVFEPNTESDPLDEAVDRIKKEILSQQEFLLLEYLAVHPENQGKGVGTALVRSGIEQAEKLGLDIFVLALEAGKRVYQRLGFRVVRELVQDDSMYGGPGRWAVYYMINERKGTAVVA